MRSLIITISLFVFPLLFWAQVELPEEFVLDSPEDYPQYREVVIESLQWLLKTPLEEEVNLRAKHNAFDLIWLSGSPSFSLEIDSRAMPFMENHEELFYTFMHGMALYQLKHPEDEIDKVKLHSYGLKAVAEMVLKSHNIDMDSSLRKVVKAYRRKQIKEYAKELLDG